MSGTTPTLRVEYSSVAQILPWTWKVITRMDAKGPIAPSDPPKDIAPPQGVKPVS